MITTCAKFTIPPGLGPPVQRTPVPPRSHACPAPPTRMPRFPYLVRHPQFARTCNDRPSLFGDTAEGVCPPVILLKASAPKRSQACSIHHAQRPDVQGASTG